MDIGRLSRAEPSSLLSLHRQQVVVVEDHRYAA
jgi:hypothetical protein